MLRALNAPDDRPRRPAAYRVPWRIDRLFESHPLVTNAGDEAAELVRVFVHDPDARPVIETWGTMLPGDTSEVCLCDVDLDDAVVTIAWFRPGDDDEFVWRFVL